MSLHFTTMSFSVMRVIRAERRAPATNGTAAPASSRRRLKRQRPRVAS